MLRKETTGEVDLEDAVHVCRAKGLDQATACNSFSDASDGVTLKHASEYIASESDATEESLIGLILHPLLEDERFIRGNAVSCPPV
jgi:hypothetical protein